MKTRIALSADMDAKPRRELLSALRERGAAPDAVARQLKPSGPVPLGVGYTDMDQLQFVTMIQALRQYADEHPSRDLMLRAPSADESWRLGQHDDDRRAEEHARSLYTELTVDDEVIITTI